MMNIYFQSIDIWFGIMACFALLLVLPQLVSAAVDTTLDPTAKGEGVVCIKLS